MPFPVLQDAQNELMDSGSQADIQAHFWSHAQRLGENVDSKDEYGTLGLCRVLTCAYYIYIYTYIQYYIIHYMLYIIYNILYIMFYIYFIYMVYLKYMRIQYTERERCNLLIIFMIFMYPIVWLLIVCLYVFIIFFGGG
jgi:hypothetical protein